MKRFIAVFVFGVLLTGCQAPVVTTRSYSFDAKFYVGDKLVELAKKYRCHHEDLTWVSSGGKEWHIREGKGAVQISGVLDDGARFQVLPLAKAWDYKFCPGRAESVDARIFVEIDESTVESFERFRSNGAQRKIDLLSSRILIGESGADLFSEQSDWPRQARGSRRYYTVYATTYENFSWKSKPEIEKLIKAKRIAWIESGVSYPFSRWTSDDMAFAKLREFDRSLNGHADLAARTPLVVEGDRWIFKEGGSQAVQWRIEPMPASRAEEHEAVPSEKFKRWIVYGNSRIEIPLRS